MKKKKQIEKRSFIARQEKNLLLVPKCFVFVNKMYDKVNYRVVSTGKLSLTLRIAKFLFLQLTAL